MNPMTLSNNAIVGIRLGVLAILAYYFGATPVSLVPFWAVCLAFCAVWFEPGTGLIEDEMEPPR